MSLVSWSPYLLIPLRRHDRRHIAGLLCGLLALISPAVADGGAQEDYGSRGNVWMEMSPGERQQIEEISDRFKVMIGSARTELAMVREAIALRHPSGDHDR